MPSPPRCACIDIGSNTTRLLVAERGAGPLREVLSQRAFTRIGAARGPDGRIADTKIAEVAAVAAEQARLARAAGAGSVRVVATAAVRTAANGDALVAAVRAGTGLAVQVLSGEQEACLAFAGATGMLSAAPAGDVAVVDVGGGSTEMAVGRAGEGVRWSASLPIGSRVLADAGSDPPAPARLAALRARLAADVGALRPPPAVAAYAVGGSAASLRRMLGPELHGPALRRGVELLARDRAAEVAERLGLHRERARLLPAAMLLLEAAEGLLGVPLHIAGGGLREGVVLEDLAKSEGDGQGS